MRSQTRRLVLCFFALAGAPHLWAQEAAATGTIRGAVVDARDGTGLERVSVRLQDTGQTTLTGNEGRFEMTNVTPGNHELYISAVDFILVKRTVNVIAGSVLELTIPITEGTGTYTETVQLPAERPDELQRAVSCRQQLPHAGLLGSEG